MNHKCRECDQEANPEMTMDFTDVQPGAFLYWCTKCGQRSQAINQAIVTRVREEPGFREKLEAALKKVESKYRN